MKLGAIRRGVGGGEEVGREREREREKEREALR
jgi:hypothetical protein